MGGKKTVGLHLQGSFPPALPRNTHHLERPCWIELLMSLERWYWLTKGQQRPMQLRDKKTYSVKDCVNKGTLQYRARQRPVQGPFRSPLFTISLGSSPRTDNLGGRPGGGGKEERGSVWVSRRIRTEGVARLSLRGRRELTVTHCVRNYQVITDDLHLKEGAVERKKLYFYRPLSGLFCCPYYTLPSAFFLSPIRVYCRGNDL